MALALAIGLGCCDSDHGQAEVSAGHACIDSAPTVVPAGVSTFAGGDIPGFTDGCGIAAKFDNPVNVLVAPGGLIFVADRGNDALRRIEPSGNVTTVASSLFFPFALTFATAGELIVAGDDGILRRVSLSSGGITPLAAGLGLSRGVAALPDGSFVVTSLSAHVIWLATADGQKTILAGSPGQPGLVDDVGPAARFDEPVDVVALGDGTLAIADLGNHRIRRVTLAGVVTTLAGTAAGYQDGAPGVAQFNGPSGLALDTDGSLYVSDRYNHRVRKIDASGQVTTMAGSGANGSVDLEAPLLASFASIEGIDVDTSNHVLYIADGDAGQPQPFHRVRRLPLQTAVQAP